MNLISGKAPLGWKPKVGEQVEGWSMAGKHIIGPIAGNGNEPFISLNVGTCYGYWVETPLGRYLVQDIIPAQ